MTDTAVSDISPATPVAGMMEISSEEFTLMRELIYQKFGINLTEQKRSLLVGRLQKMLRKEGFASFRRPTTPTSIGRRPTSTCLPKPRYRR